MSDLATIILGVCPFTVFFFDMATIILGFCPSAGVLPECANIVPLDFARLPLNLDLALYSSTILENNLSLELEFFLSCIFLNLIKFL